MLTQFNKGYSKLSAEQKDFLSNGIISKSMSARKWVRFLEPVSQYDSKRDFYYIALPIFAIVLGFCLFIVGLSTMKDIENTFLDLLVSNWFLFFLLPLIAVLILFFQLRKRDVNNNIREFIYPLLTLLSLEIGNRKKIHMAINFNKALLGGEISQNVDHDGGGFFSFGKRLINSKFYDYPVLELSCNLMDGTRLQWKVHDTVRKRKQKSSSGNSKTKYKLKRKMLLSMSFLPTVYSLKSPALAAENGFRIRENKIVYRRVLKESHTGKFAILDLEKIVEEMGMPYQYITVREGNEKM